ncbi:MAG: hypothetical protein AAB738_02465 [Patescibacteria group bacterium]
MGDLLASDSSERADSTYVPPPPSEVSIRTMDSDLKSMALSGGSFPTSQRIAVASSQSQVRKVQAGSGYLFKIFLAVGIVLVLAAVFYFAFPLFIHEKDNTPVGGNVASTTPTLPVVPPSVTIPTFSHISSFKKTPDRVVSLRLVYPARALSDLETYNQKLLGALPADKVSTATLIEVELKKEDGTALAVSQFFNVAGMKFLDEDFLAANFNLDFTAFVYKTKDGFWPGLIIKPQSGKNWILLKPGVVKLEESRDIESLFLTNPGDKTGEFEDVSVSGQLARSLKFKNPTANFIYGWFHDDLIISTSLEGLRDVIGRL